MNDKNDIRIEGIIQASEELTGKIRSISDECNLADQTHYAWMESDDFLKAGDTGTYVAFDGKKLIAWLQIFAPGENASEITGQVLPGYRSRGVFHRLLQVAEAELRRRGTDSMLLVADAAFGPGAETVEKMRGIYQFSEYLMAFSETNRATTSSVKSAVEIHPARITDRQILADIFSEAFPDEGKDSSEVINEFLSSPKRHLYSINHSGGIIGIISMYEGDSAAYIHAFAVSPEHRGKGFGRAALKQFVGIILETMPNQPIELEVETNNMDALSLYESVGFNIVTEFRYYEREVIL